MLHLTPAEKKLVERLRQLASVGDVDEIVLDVRHMVILAQTIRRPEALDAASASAASSERVPANMRPRV